MGENPKAVTPFRLQALVTQESHSLHNYRKGKLATFLGEVYEDWIIPHLAKEVVKEQRFMAELTADEMQEVSSIVIKSRINNKIKEIILRGEQVENLEPFRQTIGETFLQSNKKFIEILKDEMKKVPLGIKVNIVGKQEYLQFMVDSLVNIFNKLYRGPEDLANPAMVGLFNKILEGSGIDTVNFGAAKFAFQQASTQQTPKLEPLQVKTQTNEYISQ
jgi:hypothetical protein